MAMTTTGPVLSASPVIRRLTRWVLTCLAVGGAAVLISPALSAQGLSTSPARGSVPPGAATMEIQGVPAERTAPGSVRIDPVEEDYRIGTQDLIEVQVLGIQDLRREARVNAKGLIGLPLIGAVRVAGLTTAEAEALIGGLYRKDHLQNPEVSVFVKEFTRQNVTIEGGIAKPGTYPLKGPTTLLQLIAQAGGQGSLTDMSDVVLFRMEENERRAIKFDVTKIRTAEAPDPLVQAGDLIVVNRSPARVAIRDSLLGDIIGIFNPFNYVVRP